MRKLSQIEKKTYNLIKNAGEIQTIALRDKHMCGAIASLKSMGLVKVFKKYTSYYRKRNSLKLSQKHYHIAFEFGIKLNFVLELYFY